MPRSIRSVVAEVSLIVLTISVLGHLTVNFWERYFVKSELAQMKRSLYHLKKTLFNVGNAYDTLQRDIKGLTEFSTRNPLIITNLDSMRFKNTLDRRRLHDIEVNAMINAKNAYTYPVNVENKLKRMEASHLPFKVNHKAINDIKKKPKEATLNEPVDFIILQTKALKKKVHDIKNADPNNVTKNSTKVKFNVTTMTRNPPRSIGAGTLDIDVQDNDKHR